MFLCSTHRKCFVAQTLLCANLIVFLHPRLIFSHDNYSQQNIYIQHSVIAYKLQEEWDLSCDRSESAVESLVEWSVDELQQREELLARERQVGIGIDEAQRWLGQPRDVVVVGEAVNLIRGQDAWAMMIEGEVDSEWSD